MHLYDAAPSPANGDNAAWLTDTALGYLGSFSLDMSGTARPGIQ
jgi:hypothetical protein